MLLYDPDILHTYCIYIICCPTRRHVIFGYGGGCGSRHACTDVHASTVDHSASFFSTKDLCPNFITKATKLQSSGVYIHSSVAPAPTPTKTKIPSGGASTQGYASTQSSNDKTKRHKIAPPAEHNPKAAQTQQNTKPTNSL
jgi:hypothetical protein